jgi:hypothetical protein
MAFFYWRKLRGDKARFMLTAAYATSGGAYAAPGAFVESRCRAFSSRLGKGVLTSRKMRHKKGRSLWVGKIA